MILHRFSDPMHLRYRSPASARGTLLYLHGLGESCLSFEGLLKATPLQGYRHLAPDLPGYGKSPWPSTPLGLVDLADAVGGWLEKILEKDKEKDPAPVLILGHSMGGVLGLLLCERFPGLVQGLINVEGNVSRGDCSFSSRIAAHSLQDFEEGGFGTMLQEVYREGFEDAPIRTYFASMSLADPRTLHRCATELFAISKEEVLAQRLAALDLPQVYLLGNPRGTGARSRELLDQESIPWHAVDDAGHWLFLDQPAAFLKILVEALEGMLP